VIHRTFRSLDDPPKLVGFTLRQWTMLLLAGGFMFGLVQVTHLPAKAAISICVFVIGVPAVLAYVSESGGPQLGLLLRELCRWRLGPKSLTGASANDDHRHPRGLLVLADAPRTPDKEAAVEGHDLQARAAGRETDG